MPLPALTDPLGVLPVIPTPFTANDEVDYETLEGLVEFAVRCGAPAVCLPAYASEFYKLSADERFGVVAAAVRAARGRVKVFAQSNHPAGREAAAIARRNEDLGADFISFALPRQFALSEDDLLRYCETVAGAISRPFLVQDFNPGGATVGASFCARLLQRAAHFRYLKLEEPMMGPKVRAVRQITGDRVGVLEGWGGMYLIELLQDGISGVMPGLAMCDLFVRLFHIGSGGDIRGAMEIFRSMLPQIVFSLINLEHYHHCEKALLVARGAMPSAAVREPTVSPDESTRRHIDVVNELVLAELSRQGLR